MPYIDPSSLHEMRSPFHPYGPQAGPDGIAIKQEVDDDGISSERSTTLSSLLQQRSARDDMSTFTGEDADVDVASLTDAMKLKGVYWPGMDMFDAATPEARRKRNQKKANNVIEQLEAMSNCIEGTEMVFRSGTLRKVRQIDGNLNFNSESSPLSGEEPLPKILKRSSVRKPLAEKDPNSGQVPTRRSRRKRPARSTPAQPLDMEEEEDDLLTYGNTRQKRRNVHGSIPVHRDNDEQIASFGQPASLDTLNSNFDEDRQRQSENVQPDHMQFRPADPFAYGHQPFGAYQPSYTHGSQMNPFSVEPAFEPAWDYFGQDLNGPLANPLFLSAFQADAEDDDQKTISAIQSEK